MVSKEYLSNLIQNQKNEDILHIFEDYNVVSMSETVCGMDISDIIYLLELLPKNIGGDLFAGFEFEYKKSIFKSLSPSEVNTVLSNMYTDDIVEILQELPNVEVRKIMSNVSSDIQADIETGINYDSETAGSIMTIEFIELKADDTYQEAIDKVKSQGSVAEEVKDCYIIDDNRHLMGVIKLTDLLFGKDTSVLKDFMEVNFVTVDVNDNQEDVLDVMQKYDLHVVPVVNDQNILLGIITIDDIFDVMEEEVTKDVLQMAGISNIDDSYINTSIFKLAKARLPWLMIIMVTATFMEIALSMFSKELTILPVLAAFIPMIMGTAGNAANQSSVMVIRAIVTDKLSTKDTFAIFKKEMSTSFYLSVIMFIVTAVRMFLLPPSAGLDLVLCVSISIVVSLFLANLVGGLLPILALAFKLDPAVMVAPLVSNIMDVASLVIYFLCARVFLGI